MISVGVTVVAPRSMEGTTGSTTVPTKWWTCHLNPRTGSPRRRLSARSRAKPPHTARFERRLRGVTYRRFEVAAGVHEAPVLATAAIAPGDGNGPPRTSVTRRFRALARSVIP